MVTSIESIVRGLENGADRAALLADLDALFLLEESLPELAVAAVREARARFDADPSDALAAAWIRVADVLSRAVDRTIAPDPVDGDLR